MRLLTACSALSFGAISSYGMSPIEPEASAGLSGQTGNTACCGYAGRSVTPAAAKAVRGLKAAGDFEKSAEAATGTAASTATDAADAASLNSRGDMTVGTERETSDGSGRREAPRGCGRAE